MATTAAAAMNKSSPEGTEQRQKPSHRGAGFLAVMVVSKLISVDHAIPPPSATIELDRLPRN